MKEREFGLQGVVIGHCSLVRGPDGNLMLGCPLSLLAELERTAKPAPAPTPPSPAAPVEQAEQEAEALAPEAQQPAISPVGKGAASD